MVENTPHPPISARTNNSDNIQPGTTNSSNGDANPLGLRPSSNSNSAPVVVRSPSSDLQQTSSKNYHPVQDTSTREPYGEAGGSQDKTTKPSDHVVIEIKGHSEPDTKQATKDSSRSHEPYGGVENSQDKLADSSENPDRVNNVVSGARDKSFAERLRDIPLDTGRMRDFLDNTSIDTNDRPVSDSVLDENNISRENFNQARSYVVELLSKQLDNESDIGKVKSWNSIIDFVVIASLSTVFGGVMVNESWDKPYPTDPMQAAGVTLKAMTNFVVYSIQFSMNPIFDKFEGGVINKTWAFLAASILEEGGNVLGKRLGLLMTDKAQELYKASGESYAKMLGNDATLFLTQAGLSTIADLFMVSVKNSALFKTENAHGQKVYRGFQFDPGSRGDKMIDVIMNVSLGLTLKPTLIGWAPSAFQDGFSSKNLGGILQMVGTEIAKAVGGDEKTGETITQTIGGMAETITSSAAATATLTNTLKAVGGASVTTNAMTFLVPTAAVVGSAMLAYYCKNTAENAELPFPKIYGKLAELLSGHQVEPPARPTQPGIGAWPADIERAIEGDSLVAQPPSEAGIVDSAEDGSWIADTSGISNIADASEATPPSISDASEHGSVIINIPDADPIEGPLPGELTKDNRISSAERNFIWSMAASATVGILGNLALRQ